MIVLCRDHGGPWQHNYEKEKKMTAKEAMNSAKNHFQGILMLDLKLYISILV